MIKNKHNIISMAVLLAAVLTLPACSDVKQEMGVGRNSPDEFTVVQRAPLTLPPEYTLRPPTDPSEAQPAAEAAAAAKTTLLGKEATPAVEGNGEKTLLGKLGVTAAEPNIRKLIDEDNGYIALKSRPVAEKLIFWNDQGPSASDIPSSVVDPQKEAERIKKNKAEGKSINDGTVPVIEKKESTLDKIF
jgi:hypothetical protein